MNSKKETRIASEADAMAADLVAHVWRRLNVALAYRGIRSVSAACADTGIKPQSINNLGTNQNATVQTICRAAAVAGVPWSWLVGNAPLDEIKEVSSA